MFVDQVRIRIKAGNGGDGKVSFHREKFVANGGPDGGDGGRGGDVLAVATRSLTTLVDYYYTKHFRAGNGENGDQKKCYGRSGESITLRVPCGTVVRDVASGRIIADLCEPDVPVVLCRGGRGGLGNAHFATSRRQAPRFAQQGERTAEHEIELTLKTIADVGLVGYPNVGKSTLLSVVSAARPKIADYHFTTLTPNLGVVRHRETSFLLADIPGLIEGASRNVGLGHAFLRHIERTRLIVHVVDIGGSEGRDPLDDYDKINAELAAYSPALAALPQIVALNKADLLRDPFAVEAMRAHTGAPCFLISGATREGIDALLDAIVGTLATLPAPEPIPIEPFEWESEDGNAYTVERLDEHTFEVRGGLVTRLSANVVLDNYDSLRYFQKMLREHGVIKRLVELGATEGDTVVMGDTEFDFVP